MQSLGTVRSHPDCVRFCPLRKSRAGISHTLTPQAPADKVVPCVSPRTCIIFCRSSEPRSCMDVCTTRSRLARSSAACAPKKILKRTARSLRAKRGTASTANMNCSALPSAVRSPSYFRSSSAWRRVRRVREAGQRRVGMRMGQRARERGRGVKDRLPSDSSGVSTISKTKELKKRYGVWKLQEVVSSVLVKPASDA